jgi:class 3 adenylate cyclase
MLFSRPLESLPEASVLFSDIYDFAGITAQRSPEQVVELLNRVFIEFYQLTYGSKGTVHCRVNPGLRQHRTFHYTVT